MEAVAGGLRPARRHMAHPLRIGVLASAGVHVVVAALILLFIHGTAFHPPPPQRVIMTLDLAAPQPAALMPRPARNPPVVNPPPKALLPLPRPVPRPVTSRPVRRAAPTPVAPPPPPRQPEAQPAPPAKAPPPSPTVPPGPSVPAASPQPGVVGHHVDSAYKARLEKDIGSHLRYPRIAARRGRQGTVVVRVRMRRDGTVEQVRLLKSSGIPSLDREAQAVFRRIGHLPPLPDNFLPRASAFEFEVPISFHLLNASE